VCFGRKRRKKKKRMQSVALFFVICVVLQVLASIPVGEAKQPDYLMSCNTDADCSPIVEQAFCAGQCVSRNSSVSDIAQSNDQGLEDVMHCLQGADCRATQNCEHFICRTLSGLTGEKCTPGSTCQPMRQPTSCVGQCAPYNGLGCTSTTFCQADQYCVNMVCVSQKHDLSL
jgi:hypothetical protein